MSNIGLLMVSVLTTGLPSAKELPQLPQTEPENSLEGVLQLEQEQEIQKIQSSQIAPPETLQPDVSDSDIRLEIEPESNLPQAIPAKQNSLDTSSKLRSGISPPETIQSGVRSQESGVRSQESEFSNQKSPFTTHHSLLKTQNS